MPKTYVSRQIRIAAPAEKIFEQISNFRNWPAWSLWLIAEPDCELDFAENGNAYTWDGKRIGAGQLQKISSEASHALTCKLTIIRPWRSGSDVGFKLQSDGDACVVTWTMEGRLPWFMGWMKGMIEGMVGMDYVRGLNMLKDLCETGKLPFSLNVLPDENWPGCTYIGLKEKSKLADIGPVMEKGFTRLLDACTQRNIQPAATPLTIYQKWNMSKGICEFTMAVPVTEAPSDLPDDVISGRIPPTPAFVIEHTGPYRHLGNAWSVGMVHSRAKSFIQNKHTAPFEVYLNDPRHTPENDCVTRVYFPRKP